MKPIDYSVHTQNELAQQTPYGASVTHVYEKDDQRLFFALQIDAELGIILDCKWQVSNLDSLNPELSRLSDLLIGYSIYSQLSLGSFDDIISETLEDALIKARTLFPQNPTAES